jgi:hypothetical protein
MCVIIGWTPLFDHEKLDVYGVELGFVARVNSGPRFSMTSVARHSSAPALLANGRLYLLPKKCPIPFL